MPSEHFPLQFSAGSTEIILLDDCAAAMASLGECNTLDLTSLGQSVHYRRNDVVRQLNSFTVQLSHGLYTVARAVTTIFGNADEHDVCLAVVPIGYRPSDGSPVGLDLAACAAWYLLKPGPEGLRRYHI